MNTLHPVADLLLGLGAWLLTTAIAELIVKPFLQRKYQRLDRALGDRLPDLK
jgi:hypothetical protein